MGEVAGAPVDRGTDRAHKSGDQRHHHQAQGNRRQQRNSQRWIAQLEILLSWQQHQSSESHHHPEPTAHQVIHHQKHPARHLGLALILGGQHALNEFTAAIAAAETPPLQGQIGAEHADADAAALNPAGPLAAPLPRQQRQQLRAIHGGQLLQQLVHATHRLQGDHRHRQGTTEGQQQLQTIGDNNGPKTASHRVNEHQGRHHQQQPNRVGEARQGRLTADDAQGFHHLAHGQKGIANANAIHRQGQQKRLDSPQPRRCWSAVAQLREGGIGEHTAAAPERREHHRHGHMGQTKTPPLPIADQTAAAHQTGHVEGGIDREGGGRHRGAGQPAIEAAACNEIIVFTAVAACQPQAEHQGEQQIPPQQNPINGSH